MKARSYLNTNEEMPLAMEVAISIIKMPATNEERQANCDLFKESYNQFVSDDKAFSEQHSILYKVARSWCGFNPAARTREEESPAALNGLVLPSVDLNLLELAIKNNKIEIAQFLMENGADKEYVLDTAVTTGANDSTLLFVLQFLDSETIRTSINTSRSGFFTVFCSFLYKSDGVVAALIEKLSVETLNTIINTKVRPFGHVHQTGPFAFFTTSTLEFVALKSSYANMKKIFEKCTPKTIAESTNMMRNTEFGGYILVNKNLTPSQRTELIKRHSQMLLIANKSIYKQPEEITEAISAILLDKKPENIHNHDYWIKLLLEPIQNPNPLFSKSLGIDTLFKLDSLLETVYVSKIYSLIKEHGNNPEKVIQKIESAIPPKERKEHPGLYVLFDHLYFVMGYELFIKYHQEKTSKLESKSEVESKAKSTPSKMPDHFNLAIETWKKISNLAHLSQQEGELVSNVLKDINSNIKSSVEKEKLKVTFITLGTWDLTASFREALRPASTSSVSSSMASESSMEAVGYADSSFITQLIVKKSYERNTEIEVKVSASTSSNGVMISTHAALSHLPKSVFLSRKSSFDHLKEDVLDTHVEEEDKFLVKSKDPAFQAKLSTLKRDSSGGYELDDLSSPSESYTSESESELVPTLPASEPAAAPTVAPKRQGM